jgi:hypothetical protein
MTEYPLQPLFKHRKGVVMGRVFHRDEDTGDADVYLVEDPHLPEMTSYFLVEVDYYIDGSKKPRWKGYHGPVECYKDLAGGDLQEAFEQALSHYTHRQENDE